VEEEENDARCRVHDARLTILPNPFRNRVTITLNGADQRTRGSAGGASADQQPDLRIYDASGRLVKSFGPGSLLVAHRSLLVTWDGRDDGAKGLPAGVYFIRLAGNGNESVRIVKIR
jgi:flagellar hook assembly protein FlgD